MYHRKIKCKIVGCEGLGQLKNGKRYFSGGYCVAHYERFRSHGDPLSGGTFQGQPLKFFNQAMALETDECILWLYALSKGYGAVWYNGSSKLVSRLALERGVGPAPEGKPYALHKPEVCHNPACFNYRHLYWGSDMDNAADRTADGTENRGEKQGRSKLTGEQVRAIREDGRPQQLIAEDYGVNNAHISMIKSRKRWSWLV